MLTYPQFDKPFIVYTDASEKQIRRVITQEVKPLGYFSRKLTNTQRCYPVTEQELLAITETPKYFKHMLFGHKKSSSKQIIKISLTSFPPMHPILRQ